jgi:hypothetical protein
MPLQAVPASLRELARQIDDADEYAVDRADLSFIWEYSTSGDTAELGT